ncbi:G-protein coupled bile acid receptor 1 [Xenopus laevis]|uniref:G-protein coupled bile acid receptor 1 n=2 Tax=Xenopus laevis TaxID=8355 RepID=A0A974H3R0_XENLA|nr:G-protein coupled bile acid receptor 1 [Xenopus laevis]OCT63331.1 hypothetical protein XELAEV_18044429mg [Xenopus laevis]
MEFHPNNFSADNDLEAQRQLIFLLSSPLSVFIILSNLFIIIGIVFNKKIHNTANYFFLSLMFADLLTGVALPCIPHMRFDKKFGYHVCMISYISPNFFFLSFLANLLMVHYEKYLFIVYPLRYHSIWMHRCVPLSLVIAWTLPLFFACLPMMGWNNWKIDSNCSYKYVFTNAYIYLETYGVVIPSILAIAFITVKVLTVARKQLKDIKKLHRSVQSQAVIELEHQMDLRYARCIAIVSLTFLVCWVPYIAVLQVSVLAIAHYEFSWWIILTLTCVGSGSAAIIPIILGLCHREYTELWRNLFSRYCCKHRETLSNLHNMTSKEETLHDGLTDVK